MAETEKSLQLQLNGGCAMDETRTILPDRRNSAFVQRINQMLEILLLPKRIVDKFEF